MSYFPNWLNPFKRRIKFSPEEIYRQKLEKALKKVEFKLVETKKDGSLSYVMDTRDFYKLVQEGMAGYVFLGNEQMRDIALNYEMRFDQICKLERGRRRFEGNVQRQVNLIAKQYGELFSSINTSRNLGDLIGQVEDLSAYLDTDLQDRLNAVQELERVVKELNGGNGHHQKELKIGVVSAEVAE